ncbi:MAG: glycosyltransferase family 4 protein [Pseudomonadota bacterium]
MRLFYFVTDSYPAWRVDIAELFSYELKKLGLHTDWSMRRDNSGAWQKLIDNKQTIYLPLSIEGLSVISPIIRRMGEFLAEIWLMLKLIIGQKYDVIQVRDDRYTAAIFAFLAARLRGSKFVYWVSFPFPENDLEKAGLTTGIRAALFKCRGLISKCWLYKIVLPLADHVFVQSEGMKQNIIGYGVPPEKMTAVPMGVSTKLFGWLKTANVAPELESVVYLGTFALSRHLEVLIEAFALVLKQRPNAKLYMVGRGDTPEDRKFLEDLASQLQITPNIIFTGFLPIEQAWAIAAKAAVCISPIYPSFIYLQGSPTKLYEYMALGRPIVANDHPEQTIALQNNTAGLCVPWGAQAFADATLYMLNNPKQAEKMAKNGPQWIAENRRYDKIAARVFTQYQSMLSE